jgi:hypothetical protein
MFFPLFLLELFLRIFFPPFFFFIYLQ